MAEVKEIPKSQKVAGGKVLHKEQGRREFLGAALKFAVGGLAALKVRDIIKDPKEEAVKTMKIFGGPIDRDNVYLSPKKVEIETLTDPNREVIESLFPGLDEHEMSSLFVEINKERDVMLSRLTIDSFRRIGETEALIGDVSKYSGVPKEILIGMMLVESNGDRLAVSAAGAKGLTQIMDPMAKKYGLSISDDENDDRFVPDRSLPATAMELREAYSRFNNDKNHDWGIAVWEWHVGAPRIWEAYQTYLASEGIVKLEAPHQVKPMADSAKAREQATVIAEARKVEYQRVISEKNINVHRLFQNNEVFEMFSGDEWNQTSRYVYRLAAAATIYNDLARLGYAARVGSGE